MAGINSQQVYLPTPDQSATTGAVAVAPVGTTAPANARVALANTWKTGGYIDENGISLSLNKSLVAIKDWSQSTVRKALQDFDGTISLNFLQVDEFAATRILGEDNVTTTAASASAGNQLTMKIGASMPPIEAWCFSMKDENRRVRVYVPKGQITEFSGSPTFVPNQANVWPCTLSCYDNGDNVSIIVMYDDGTVITNKG